MGFPAEFSISVSCLPTGRGADHGVCASRTMADSERQRMGFIRPYGFHLALDAETGKKGSFHDEWLQSFGRDVIAAIKCLVVMFVLLSWGWSCSKLQSEDPRAASDPTLFLPSLWTEFPA